MTSRLKVAVEDPQYELMQRWAKFRGHEDVLAWAKATLVSSIPLNAEAQMANMALAESSRAEAYAAPSASTLTDSIPQASVGMIMPAMPTPQMVLPKAALPPPGSVAAHPCQHLRAGAPPPWKAKDCQGTCTHPAKNGSVCHWASVSAKSCPTFRHKGPPPNRRAVGQPGASRR